MAGFPAPARRFLFSAAGVVAGAGAMWMHATITHQTVLSASVELGLCTVALAAAVVYLRGSLAKRFHPQPAWADAPAPPAPPVPSPGLRVLERIGMTVGLIALGFLAGRFEWGQWIAAAGALAYCGWRTWGAARIGRLSAAGAPFYFMALVGGAGVFLLIGWFCGAVAKG